MTTKIQQHSLSQSVMFHLLPGVLILFVYLLLVLFLKPLGLPSILLIYVTIGLALVPSEILILYWVKKKQNLSFQELIPYQRKVKPLVFIALALALFTWAGISFGITSGLDSILLSTVFSWVPGQFLLNEDFSTYSNSILGLTIIVGLIFNALLGPIVEEFYFRGFLLPRIDRYGKLAPLINIVLFSLYHFFTPWQNIARIIGLLPFAYVAMWKKNIYIAMVAHVLGNTVSVLGLIAIFFN